MTVATDRPTTGRPEVDFDHLSLEYAARAHELFRELRHGFPVAWTPHYGGFWVVSRYDDVATVLHDDATYSSRHLEEEDGIVYQGILIPPRPSKHIPLEMDPPDFFNFRRALNPLFAPAVAEALKPRVLELTTACIDAHIESGAIDLVMELGVPVPAMITLEFVGLPLDDWQRFAHINHAAIYTPPTDPAFEQFRSEQVRLREAFRDQVHEERARRAAGEHSEQADGLIAQLLEARIDGRELTDDEVAGICNLALVGGIDTTTSTFACALHYLGEDRAARQALIDEPELLPSAIEEFIRFFAPVQTLARTVARDTVLGGQDLRRGDRLMVLLGSANHDERVFPRADSVELGRFPNRNFGFGVGIHRCLGSHIARAELTVMLGEVLRRMPDYEVSGGWKKYPSIGFANGYIQLPVTFTSGGRLAPLAG
jgi:cytochrome P450